MLFLFKTTMVFIEAVDLILMSEKFSPVAEFIDMQGFILTHSLLKRNKWMRMSLVDYISQRFYSECFHLHDFEDLISLLTACALHQKSIVM